MRPRRRIVIAVAALAILLLLGRFLAAVALDYQWYASMGAASLWRSRAAFTLLGAAVTGVLGTLFVFANLYAVRGSVVSLVLPRRVANLEIGEEVPSRYLLAGTVLLSLLLGAVLTQTDWVALARVFYGARFGENDPYFQRDLGFFVYWLPVERALYLWALLSVLLVTAVVVFLYALTPSLRWERGMLRVSQYVRRHLSVLASFLLLILAWSYRLDAFSLLGHGSGDAGAFSYVDHRVLVPASVLLSILTLAGSLVVLWSGWTGQLRLAFGAVSALVVLSLGLHHVAPALARRFADQQDPAVRERPYLATRAAYTRRAFALEEIGESDSSIRHVSSVAQQVPVWDDAALLRAMQRSRGGTVMEDIGALAPENGPLAAIVVAGNGSAADAWSAARVSLSQVDERGGPVLLDRRGARSDDWMAVPPVVVGEPGGGYAIVADSGAGIAGIGITDGVGRLVPAWALQNFRLLTQDLPHPSPRLVLKRGVRERVRALAPFFEQGSEIVPALLGDTLVWMVPLYTTAPDYPLSQRVRVDGVEHPFLHHAGTAVVNATSGRVRVVVDTVNADPIVTSWRRAFPALFTLATDLPVALADQLPPATDGALAQRAAYAIVGDGRDRVSPRHPPVGDGADTAFGSSPSRFATAPGALALSLPLLSVDERVEGTIVALGGPAPRTRWIPASAGMRWSTAIDRLRAPDTTLGRDARDVRVVRGPLRAVPGERDVTLVQSAYAWRQQGSVTLLGMLLARGDSAIVARTPLELATPPELPGLSPLVGDLRTRAAALYDSLRAAQRRGDWRGYADHWEALGRLLGRPTR